MTLPDGPKAPTVVQMIQWLLDPLSYLETAARRYGDIFTARVGWDFTPHVFVSNPQAIEQIFNGDPKKFSPFMSSSYQQFAKPLVGENSVVMMKQEQHRQRRQLLMPHFHGERIEAYGHIIRNIAEEAIAKLTPGQAFTARDLTLDISVQVIFEAVLGIHEGERYEPLKQIITRMLDAVSTPLNASLLFLPSLQLDLGPWSPWGHFNRIRQQVDSLLEAEIQERRQNDNGDRRDIFAMLMSARDETGRGMSDGELRDQLKTLLFAGYDTTATSMAWALYWFHRLPEVRLKLLAELDSLGENPDPIAISRLPYLTAFCQETLRIYPLVLVKSSYVVVEPVELMGYHLEPGTNLVASIYLTHQREDVYPEPKQFKPERFLERQFSRYEYLPFGGGSRGCIGSAFGMFEMKVALANILSRYEMDLADRRPVQAQRRMATIIPAGGLKMVFKGQRQKAKQPLAVA